MTHELTEAEIEAEVADSDEWAQPPLSRVGWAVLTFIAVAGVAAIVVALLA